MKLLRKQIYLLILIGIVSTSCEDSKNISQKSIDENLIGSWLLVKWVRTEFDSLTDSTNYLGGLNYTITEESNRYVSSLCGAQMDNSLLTFNRDRLGTEYMFNDSCDTYTWEWLSNITTNDNILRFFAICTECYQGHYENYPYKFSFDTLNLIEFWNWHEGKRIREDYYFLPYTSE